MYTDDERRIFEHDDNRCPGCGAAVSDDEDSPNHDRYFAIGDIWHCCDWSILIVNSDKSD